MHAQRVLLVGSMPNRPCPGDAHCEWTALDVSENNRPGATTTVRAECSAGSAMMAIAWIPCQCG
jgi:hypothetical protein